MRTPLLALTALLLSFAWAAPHGACADEAAKDQEIARLQAEVARLEKRVKELERALAAATGGAGGAAPTAPPPLEVNQGQEASREQLKYLLYLYKSYKPAAGQPQHPALDGKRFVLFLVAVNQLERGNEGPLKMLFSPADKKLAFPGVEAYAGVTVQALARQSFPNLTSYAGRRNAAPGLAITPTSPPATTALFADLSFSDGALVAFLDGKVRYMNRRDLGLAPTDPLVAGPTSKSPLLQTLSAE